MLLLLLLVFSTVVFTVGHDPEVITNAVWMAIECVVDVTDTAVLALREIPFDFYFSFITALVAQAFQDVTQCVQTIFSLPYAEYTTAGASIAHQMFNTARLTGSWLLSQLDSAEQAIHIIFDPSTAPIAVFIMYAAMLGLLYMILRSILDVFSLIWRVIRFFIYPALFLVGLVMKFGFRRRPRHPRCDWDWNWDAGLDIARSSPDTVSHASPSFASRQASSVSSAASPKVSTTELFQRISDLIDD